MKDKIFGRSLDHIYTISRMDIFEHKAYELIYKDTEFKSSNWTIVIDKFIETCLQYDCIVREHLYYPKKKGDLK